MTPDEIVLGRVYWWSNGIGATPPGLVTLMALSEGLDQASDQFGERFSARILWHDPRRRDWGIELRLAHLQEVPDEHDLADLERWLES